MLKEGIIISERYEIISRVGVGGMADVYKAKDHKLNRLVAVKVLKAEFREDKTFVSKFQKEAQSAAILSHPNVVNVYDVGEDRGLYYIVMELVEGITLKNYISRKGKLSIKEATSIAIQVSLGLEAAHNQGIIHRDVKPQNIIISTDGKVKLSDFGIAKAINSNTITANVMGSVHYSSPEQVRGGFSDSKSDIYSLGITMYEMVTGRVPFDGDTTVSIAIKHLQEEMVPPSRYTPDLPYSLEQIIIKCTQKSPDRRYNNIGELIEDLKRSLIDPQGNFVSLVPLTAHANTVNIPQSDVDAIRAAGAATSKKKSYDDDDDYDEDDDEDSLDAYDDDDDEDEKSSGLEKAITIGGFVIGAVIIVILILVIGNMAGLFNKNSSSSSNETTAESTEEGTITVPDFRGMTLAEAQTKANELGIGIKQTSTAASDTYASGQVMSQDVTPNTKVAENTTINVVISSGAANITIPTGLAGMAQTDAENSLIALGLTPAAVLQASDTVATGCVIGSDPAEGTAVAAGTTVTLYISSGSTGATVTVPDVTGYDQSTAMSILDEYGLTYTATTGYDSNYEVGQVIAISPGAGTAVPAGSSITLTINSTDAATEQWVCYSTLSEPEEYMGGNVTLELVQGDYSNVFYEGGNPWGDSYVYSQPIYGQPGVSTGTINVYEEGVLIARYNDVQFEAP